MPTGRSSRANTGMPSDKIDGMQTPNLEPAVTAWIRRGEARDRRWRWFFGCLGAVGVIAAIVVPIAIVHTLGSAVIDRRAREAIRANGLADIQLGDTDPGVCEVGESARHFAAVRGSQRVEGTACCGVLYLPMAKVMIGQACTLRWGR